MGRVKHAYVTLLTHGDDYVPGAEALGQSLVRTGSTVPRVVMVTSDVPDAARRAVEASGWQVVEVEGIANPEATELFPRFRHVFTKLRVFGLEGFDQVVFLDADTLVLQNIDDLFGRAEFAAAPDFLMADEFNSGVMLLTPSPALLDRMLKALGEAGSYDGGDQGFLNQFIGDWYTGPPERRLPAAYNTHHFIYQFIDSHPRLRDTLGPTIKIIHYTVQKPWQDRPVPTLSGGAGLWWRTYLELHPELDKQWRRRARSLQDLAFDRVIKWVVG